MARFGRSFPIKAHINYARRSTILSPFASKSLTVVYNILNLVSKSKTFIYNIVQSASITKSLVYNINGGGNNARMDWEPKDLGTMDWISPDISDPSEFKE
jgi:hypothetical protein